MKAQIPWLRVFVEGVVIVASILLAFGIQAWWDGRQDDLLVRSGLAGVLEELDAVRARLEFDGSIHQRMLLNTQALQSLLESAAVGQTLAVPDTLMVGLFEQYVSDPPTAMVAAFITAGHADKLLDDTLRRSLLSWIAQLQDQRADQTRASEYGSLELQPYLRAEFDVLRVQRVLRALTRDELASSPGGGRLATNIRVSPRLRNLVGWQLDHVDRIARQNEALRHRLDEFDSLVRGEIRLH